jgi:ribA/ribD-fused uncharacterized protein
LSNFWKAEITYDGIKYPTTENAYQAAKTLDTNERQTIANLDKPVDAKRAGKKVTLRSGWDGIKDGIMLDVLKVKFATYPDLAKKLIDTKDAILVEGNLWHDTYFGVCYCDKCMGVGENKLGELLMEVREQLKSVPKINATYGMVADKSDTLDIPEI